MQNIHTQIFTAESDKSGVNKTDT